MPWECGQCGAIAGLTEAEALEHGRHCGEPAPAPSVEVESTVSRRELEVELMGQRQTAALEVIAVELAKIAKSMERLAYRPWSG